MVRNSELIFIKAKKKFEFKSNPRIVIEEHERNKVLMQFLVDLYFIDSIFLYFYIHPYFFVLFQIKTPCKTPQIMYFYFSFTFY